jgi:glutamate synthase domain-containing protein 3
VNSLDLNTLGLRAINQQLQSVEAQSSEGDWIIVNPKGQHAIACGLKVPMNVTVDGHVGFYCAGMNKEASVTINGHAGVGLAENMMSGTVRVKGNASQSAGATAHGGLLVIEGDASSRCGISMKGIDIVVGGSVGHMSGFMAQLGNMVICGDAGEALGDSIYEAVLYVAGSIESLGADCIEKEMTPEHLAALTTLLNRAGMGNKDPHQFRRYGSVRKLYHFDIDHADAY